MPLRVEPSGGLNGGRVVHLLDPVAPRGVVGVGARPAGELLVDGEPLLDSGLRIRLDRVDRALRLAGAAVDALIWIDH